ncbi:hypothetical protein BCR44DRAFT_127953 [Catenaria anguillulae PL171]|uniref:UspA domain-containing protein n=1 Tax=Catenaria anguillulae PL171 TaxID=765915 RepID=A0A1Y2HTB7_9FUNG|nr:hypothetical protein BCR44DRAFT_127953 [Catenaria anguillulae PL171]
MSSPTSPTTPPNADTLGPAVGGFERVNLKLSNDNLTSSDGATAGSSGAAGRASSPSRSESSLRTILIPVDDSPHSDYTVQWAQRNFILPTDKVVLVNVRPGAKAEPSLESMSKPELRARENAFELIRSYAKTLSHSANGTVPKEIQGFAMRGDAKEALLRKAEMIDADTIVMGARSGRGKMTRMLLGSVSDHLAQNAPCPVVIVREHHKLKEKAKQEQQTSALALANATKA